MLLASVTMLAAAGPLGRPQAPPIDGDRDLAEPVANAVIPCEHDFFGESIASFKSLVPTGLSPAAPPAGRVGSGDFPAHALANRTKTIIVARIGDMTIKSESKGEPANPKKARSSRNREWQ